MMKVEERWRRLRLRQWLAICATAGVIACGGGSGDDDDDSTGVPDPYTPPAEGAPVCELSADCPAGTYCDLGECFQSCNTDLACSEATSECSNRGRCQAGEPGGNDIEPPLETSNDAEIELPVGEGMLIGETDAVAMLELRSAPTDAEVRYRVEPRVPWLSVGEPRGVFSGALVKTLTVDRTGLAPGQHTGVVVVHTTVGNVTVPVRLWQGVTGRYGGTMTYTAPRPVGNAPLVLEILENAGAVTVRVDRDVSPLFVRGDGTGLAAAGTFADGTLAATLRQRIEPTDLDPEQFWDRPLGRELAIELTVTVDGGLEGEFTETWHGLMAEPIVVSGTLRLARDGDAEPGFGSDAPPAMPAAPDVTPPVLSADCTEAARVAAALPAGGCDGDSTAIEYFSCGNAIRARGAQLEDPTNGLVIDSPGDGYSDFVSDCAQDLALSESISGIPTAVAADCIWPGNLHCARSLFGRSSLNEGYQGIGMVASNYAGVGALLVNDALVQAYRKPYLAALDDGRARARIVLRGVFEAQVLDGLRNTPAFVANEESYKPLRRVAHLLGRHRLASDERMRVLVRSTGLSESGREQLRQQTAKEMTSLLVGLLALGVVEQAQEAPPTPELGLFTEALTGLAKQYAQLSDPQDPLGLPAGFVEFLYDPMMPAAGATNYQHVLARHSIELNAAVSDEAVAEAAVREFDTNVSLVQSELQQIENQQNSRLIALCGAAAADPTQPDLANCGASTGELAQARAEIDIELQNVSIATTRIEAHEARIQVQIERIDAIESIRGQTVEFVEQTGERLDANTYQDASYRRSQELIAAGAGLIGGLLSAAVDPTAPFRGILNWGAAGLNASISDLRTQLAVEREQLLRAQQLQIMEADYAVESINLMAQLKELFIQKSELNEEMALTKLRLFAAGLRLQRLVEEVKVVQAERDLLASQATASFANDPMFRVLRDRSTAKALASREQALLGIYKVARAFEFEINTPLGAIVTDLVPAHRASQIEDFVTCMESRFTDFRSVFGVPQVFVDEISLREDVLGIHGPIVDEVTGQTVSESEQFRRRLLQPTNRSRFGGVGFSFATSLSPGNGVFSTGVCNDQVRNVQIKLIGDGQGDDQARVRLEQAGASLMRSCEAFRGGSGDKLLGYHLLPRSVEVQAGVNDYPATLDSQLFGRAVAASEWVLTIPPGSEAPQNADLDLSRIDDIVLRVEHSATSLSDAPLSFVPTCN